MTEKSENILPSTEVFLAADSRAADGLVYISETDAPIKAFAGGPAETVTAEELRRQTGTAADAPITTLGPDPLFAQLTRIQDWYGEPEKAKAARFGELVDLLRANLRDLTEFRIGNIRIEIFIVGITAHGRLAGISTLAVET